MKLILIVAVILADIAFILLIRMFSRRNRVEIIALITLTVLELYVISIFNNEFDTMKDLKTLVTAEYTYASRNRQVFTSSFQELDRHTELNDQLVTGAKSGYIYTVYSPPQNHYVGFVLLASPKMYGLTGLNSFLTDGGSVIRYTWRYLSPSDIQYVLNKIAEGKGCDWNYTEAFIDSIVGHPIIKTRPNNSLR